MHEAKKDNKKSIKGNEKPCLHGPFNNMAGKGKREGFGLFALLMYLRCPSSPSTSADHYLHLLYWGNGDLATWISFTMLPSPQISLDLQIGEDLLPPGKAPPLHKLSSFPSSLWPCSLQPSFPEGSVILASLASPHPTSIFYFPHPGANVSALFLLVLPNLYF